MRREIENWKNPVRWPHGMLGGFCYKRSRENRREREVLRAELWSYFLPNCYRKNPGFWLSAVVKTGRVVSLGGVAMEMEIKKTSICENVAELGLHRKACRIRVVAVLEVLQPNSGRSAASLEAAPSQARAQAGTTTPTGLIEWFYRPFQRGAADGVTRLSEMMGMGRTALDGTFLRRHCGNE